jgi:hypothetical protein
MPFAIRSLIARGYWKEAGEGEGGGGGGGGEDAAAIAAAAAASAAAAAAAALEAGSGKSKPTDAEAALLKEVMDKKAANKALNDQLAQATAQLEQFKGLDPVAIRALLAGEEDRKTKDLEAKGAWDVLKKQLVETHATESGLTKAELAAAREEKAKLAEKIADLTVGVAFGQSKFLAEDISYSVSKMRAFFGPHFEFDGEKVVGYDKPAGAKDRVVLMDAKGDPLDFESALSKLVDADPDADQMKKSKQKPGAGSKTETKGKLAERTVEMTGRDRISAGLKALASK